MFRMVEEFTGDLFNKENRRNLKNTDKGIYNCGGYALGTFSWYCPHNEEDEDWWFFDYSFEDEFEAYEKTMYCVAKMILDFEGRLRLVRSLDKVHKDERVIAFRLSSDGDFHYVKKMGNGRWYHKRGACRWIDRMTEEEVFETDWCDRYDGPIVLLAMKK